MKLSQKSDAVWTSQQDEELRRQLSVGRSVNEIAIQLKRSPLSVRTRVKKLGISQPQAD
jgi:DNA-binding NarL/FixJ family response regulator